MAVLGSANDVAIGCDRRWRFAWVIVGRGWFTVAAGAGLSSDAEGATITMIRKGRPSSAALSHNMRRISSSRPSSTPSSSRPMVCREAEISACACAASEPLVVVVFLPKATPVSAASRHDSLRVREQYSFLRRKSFAKQIRHLPIAGSQRQ